MSEINWEEITSKSVTYVSKAPARELVDNVPPAIVAMAQKALTANEFGWFKAPTKDLVEPFMLLIRSAGQFTDPKSTVLASVQKKDAAGKDDNSGKLIRFSAGQRRGRKTGDTTEADKTLAYNLLLRIRALQIPDPDSGEARDVAKAILMACEEFADDIAEATKYVAEETEENDENNGE